MVVTYRCAFTTKHYTFPKILKSLSLTHTNYQHYPYPLQSSHLRQNPYSY